MVYSITFELKSGPSTPERQGGTLIWVKSDGSPSSDKIRKLVQRLYGANADLATIHVVKGGEEWDEKEMQKGARLYDLDQE